MSSQHLPSPSHRFLRWYFQQRWRGFHFFHNLLLKGQRLVTRNAYGALFALHPKNYIDSIVLREGYYESEIIECIKEYDGKSFVFWDIGSHFGLHGITVKKLFPESTVCVFEPLPAMGKLIRENAQLNDFEIEIFDMGLMDTAGAQELFTEVTQSEGESSFVAHERSKLTHRITVDCETAENLIREGRAPRPHIIKIDVEGAELNVLQGFDEYLQDPQLQFIIFEAFNSLLEDQQKGDVYDLLTKNGFVIKKLARREQSEHLLGNYLAHR